jgi:hypothetical protein
VLKSETCTWFDGGGSRIEDLRRGGGEKREVGFLVGWADGGSRVERETRSVGGKIREQGEKHREREREREERKKERGHAHLDVIRRLYQRHWIAKRVEK